MNFAESIYQIITTDKNTAFLCGSWMNENYKGIPG